MPPHGTQAVDSCALGRRLREARTARGFTQQDAAEALAVARTTITSLEQGDHKARPDELIRLASLYGKRVSDLVGPKDPVADFAVLFHTAAALIDAGDVQNELREVLPEFKNLCQDYLYLEQLNGIPFRPAYPPQYPTNGLPPEEVGQDIASCEHNRLGLGDGPILQLRETLELDVGLRVFSIPLPSRMTGIFIYTDELGGCIAVNARHPAELRRWSLAYEYAHFLTSRHQPNISILNSHHRVSTTGQIADTFARCLLMPAQELRRRFNGILQTGGGKVTAADVCRIAHYYFVSVEAMTLRLEELGVLPQGVWERLRNQGLKVRQAPEFQVLPLRPSDGELLPLRYKLLAARAYEAERLTEGQLAQFLRTDRVSARGTFQRLRNTVHVLDGGEVVALPLELAASITKQVS